MSIWARDYPPPRSRADVRNAATLARHLANGSEPACQALWDQIMANDREPQVLSSFCALIRIAVKSAMATGAQTVALGIEGVLPPEALHATTYLVPLIGNQMGISEIPPADRQWVGVLLCKLLLSVKPHMAADLQFCLDDPDWPPIDGAEIGRRRDGLA